MNRFTCALCLIVLVFVASFALAEIPKLINYQGMLTESDGTTPVTDGQYNLGFKIYGSDSGDDSLWWEYHSNVQVTNGLFNVILGSQAVLNLPFDADYWLETIVETEIMPTRLQFTSVGYAYRALVADSAAVAGSGGGGGWVDDGTVVRLQNSTDSVGIGTASPGAKLQVGDGSSDDCIRVMGSAAAVSAEMGSHLDGFGYLKINDDGGTTTALIDPDGGVSYVKYGSVGIGTTSPDTTLHVNGNLKVTGAYTGDIGPDNGAPFPRPAYDSGWITLAQGADTVLTHNIGGDVDNYFVDLWFKGAAGRHNYAYGGEIDPAWGYRGAYWRELTNTQVEVYRNPDDGSITQVRVRIWVYQ